MVTIELTMLELEAVRKAVFAAHAQPAVAAEIGEDLLLGIDRKLAAAGRDGLCSHCGERPGRGVEGWCQRCSTYVRKYDRLPSQETIIKSSLRRSQQSARPPDRRPRSSRP